MRYMTLARFKKRMRSVVEVCGLANVLGKDIGTLSHGYRQRVGLAQALVHDPPILILDEPTSDLDPNEKAEVIRYIQEIGKDRTVVLSTHNLSEVEASCARAIIISKGRVVADGSIDEVRARSGRVRYVVTIDEQQCLEGDNGGYRRAPDGPPTVDEVHDALTELSGASNVTELPTDEKAHSFSLLSDKGSDLRPEIFQLAVQKGWMMLEMRRETRKLEDVFKALTRGDEILDRGRPLAADDELAGELDDDDLDDGDLDDGDLDDGDLDDGDLDDGDLDEDEDEDDADKKD